MDALLTPRNFKNCLEFITKFNIENTKIYEKNITNKSKNENEFYLITSDSVLLLKGKLEKIAEYIYKKDGDTYAFLLTLQDSLNDEINYENLYNNITNLKEILEIEEIHKICFTKPFNIKFKIDFVKMKQIL